MCPVCRGYQRLSTAQNAQPRERFVMSGIGTVALADVRRNARLVRRADLRHSADDRSTVEPLGTPPRASSESRSRRAHAGPADLGRYTGVVAAVDATRLWAASLVCASATAHAVNASGLGEPSYVITGSAPVGACRAAVDRRAACRLGVEVVFAQPLHVDAVRGCVVAAYGQYVERLGTPPTPMLDDYDDLIRLNRPGFVGGS